MSVLVFSRTTGYRHESIPAGIATVRELGFDVTATEDPAVFTELSSYQVVVFLNTSGDVLSSGERQELESYVRGGGGFVGVHCATNTETGWPFFGDLVGARFAGHPHVQPATMHVLDRFHPATAHLGSTWERVDEWYNFDAYPRPAVRVLLTVDESTYDGGTMGERHPLAWCHDELGGRAFYTALGHAASSYEDPLIRAHLHGAITWAGAGPRGWRPSGSGRR